MNEDTPRQDIAAMLDEHLAGEFRNEDVGATMATMSPEPHLDQVPAMTGGYGRDEVEGLRPPSLARDRAGVVGDQAAAAASSWARTSPVTGSAWPGQAAEGSSSAMRRIDARAASRSGVNAAWGTRGGPLRVVSGSSV